MTEFPSVAASGPGRLIGQIMDSLPIRIFGVKLSYLLFGLPLAPLGMLLFLLNRPFGSRYILTNRSVQVWSSLGTQRTAVVDLNEIVEVELDQRPGQTFFRASDICLKVRKWQNDSASGWRLRCRCISKCDPASDAVSSTGTVVTGDRLQPANKLRSWCSQGHREQRFREQNLMNAGFGIVGTGMIAHFHAKAIQAMPGGRVAGCFNQNADKAVAFAKEYGCRAYSTLDELLADAAVGIVTICTPSGAHRDPAIAAANAGRHVVVEKPLEISLSAAMTLSMPAIGMA